MRFHPLGSGQSGYGGKLIEDRQAVAIDLSVNDLRSTYSTRCRTAVRKALNNGLSVRIGSQQDMSNIFPEFYREGMRAIGAEEFYLFNDAYFASLSRWEKARLLICYDGDDWLSAGIFLTEGDIMEYHLSTTVLKGRSLGATNLLLDAAAHLGREQEVRIYIWEGERILPAITRCFSLNRVFLPQFIHFDWVRCF